MSLQPTPSSFSHSEPNFSGAVYALCLHLLTSCLPLNLFHLANGFSHQPIKSSCSHLQVTKAMCILWALTSQQHSIQRPACCCNTAGFLPLNPGADAVLCGPSLSNHEHWESLKALPRSSSHLELVPWMIPCLPVFSIIIPQGLPDFYLQPTPLF